MSTISTHVLDTASGLPAAGVRLRLFGAASLLFEGMTDMDGRCPALRDVVLARGTYRLEFEIGAYFRAQDVALSDPPFLDCVPILFGIGKEIHTHVPLLASPYGYSTYRGS